MKALISELGFVPTDHCTVGKVVLLMCIMLTVSNPDPPPKGKRDLVTSSHHGLAVAMESAS